MNISRNLNKDNLLGAIVEGILRKKGQDITTLNLDGLENSFCSYFVICNAESNRQVIAIADSIEDYVKKELSERVWHKEGFENAQWILLDYGNIVVHIFQNEYRKFYDLENLWADATVERIHED